MRTQKVAENKVRKCKECGDDVTELKNREGKTFLATVYQEGHELVVVTKNGFPIEHRHA